MINKNAWTKGRGIKPSKYDVILREFLTSGSECSLLTLEEPKLKAHVLREKMKDRIFSHRLSIDVYVQNKEVYLERRS